jgi:uncharacterized repeat protein (TIGR02543 family)
MNLHTNIKIRKILLASLLIVCLVSFLGMGNSSMVQAQDEGPNGDYYTETTVTLKDGKQVNGLIIHGPPHPPPGQVRKTVALPAPDTALGVGTLTVPAYDWSFGCSATSGSMIAAFYDRNDYADIYTGPTNGGVMPLNSSVWPNWTDVVGDTYGQCPLTASHLGLDGRTTRGSIDDYWVSYLSNAPDPYITGVWSQHAWGDAIGDYMKTSQSAYDNVDGSTVFYNWTRSSAPLTCDDMVDYGITEDGTYGRKEFYEAKGYTVTDCFNQNTDNIIRGGFSFAMFQAEINAGRPVMLNLKGHTVVGIGYDSSTNTVYLNDTWDYLTHSMTWGGSYAGLRMQSVSIVNLVSSAPTKYTLSVAKDGTGTGTVTSSPGGINCGATCAYDFNENTSVTLTATPDAGSTFAGWGGACSGTGTCTVNLTSPLTVTATFNLNAPACYSLTVGVRPSGSGTVSVSTAPNCGTQYTPGTSVSLTAIPNPKYIFTKWTGSVTGTGNPLTITMDGNKAITANFKRTK